MSKMTLSVYITSGQIAKINDLISAALRKSGFKSDLVQKVIENQGAQLTSDFLTSLQKRIDVGSSILSRVVKNIDRTRSPEQVLEATRRKQDVNDSVVSAMLMGEGNEEEIFFLKRDCFTSDNDWDKHLEENGLVPCDPVTIARFNEDEPTFADDHPNGTHWKDDSGDWCFVDFYRWDGGRNVNVDRSDGDWRGDWWFAGVRK